MFQISSRSTRNRSSRLFSVAHRAIFACCSLSRSTFLAISDFCCSWFRRSIPQNLTARNFSNSAATWLPPRRRMTRRIFFRSARAFSRCVRLRSSVASTCWTCFSRFSSSAAARSFERTPDAPSIACWRSRALAKSSSSEAKDSNAARAAVSSGVTSRANHSAWSGCSHPRRSRCARL